MRDRPLGVTVICALQLIAAVLMLGLFCIGGSFFLDYGKRQEDYLLVSPRTLVAIAMLLGYLYLFTSFGMYTGRKWGWWLGVLSYSGAASLNIYVVIEMLRVQSQLDVPIAEMKYMIAKTGVKAVLAVMILVYLFQEHVREFYRLEHRSPYLDFAVVVGSTALVNVGLGLAGSQL